MIKLSWCVVLVIIVMFWFCVQTCVLVFNGHCLTVGAGNRYPDCSVDVLLQVNMYYLTIIHGSWFFLICVAGHGSAMFLVLLTCECMIIASCCILWSCAFMWLMSWLGFVDFYCMLMVVAGLQAHASWYCIWVMLLMVSLHAHFMFYPIAVGLGFAACSYAWWLQHVLCTIAYFFGLVFIIPQTWILTGAIGMFKLMLVVHWLVVWACVHLDWCWTWSVMTVN